MTIISSEPKYGGYSRQYFFALGLAARGYSVLVVSSSYSHFLHDSISDDIERFGAPDLVVGCSMHPFTWIGAQYVARRTHFRFFVEVRDLWPAAQIYNHGMSP